MHLDGTCTNTCLQILAILTWAELAQPIVHKGRLPPKLPTLSVTPEDHCGRHRDQMQRYLSFGQHIGIAGLHQVSEHSRYGCMFLELGFRGRRRRGPPLPWDLSSIRPIVNVGIRPALPSTPAVHSHTFIILWQPSLTLEQALFSFTQATVWTTSLSCLEQSRFRTFPWPNLSHFQQ